MLVDLTVIRRAVYKQLGVPHLRCPSKQGVLKASDLETYSVVVKDSSPMILARPKSAIFIDSSLSISRMFSGLMSR